MASSGSAGQRWLTGAGAANWCDQNGVDAGAKKVFLSLSLEDQDAIRKRGTVRNCRNPSLVLMTRIREVAGPGYIPETDHERLLTDDLIQQDAVRQQIVVVLRGEAFRIGGRGTHGTDLSTEDFEKNVRSIYEHLVHHISKSYKVLLFGDIIGDASRQEEVYNVFKRCVPKGTAMEIRVKKFFSGLNQVDSVMSCMDLVYHFLRMRKKLEDVEGAYIIRTDISLLDKDLSEWPKDKLCFPWRTTYRNLQNSVNDVIFYVPQFLFEDFRAALAKPHPSVVGDYDNLHWLGEMQSLKEHVWFQYEFSHPSNTARCLNPVYILRGRPEGEDCYGKFIQYGLEQEECSESKSIANNMTRQERLQEWSKRVRTLAEMEYNEGRDLRINQFLNLWCLMYGDDCVKWYQPQPKILRSLLMVEGIQRVDDSSVKLSRASSGSHEEVTGDRRHKTLGAASSHLNSERVSLIKSILKRQRSEDVDNVPPWRKFKAMRRW